MIDFSHIEAYKENNRIEAKKAVGGLPHSIWETYSAFANALGGIILLGVEEHPDKSLHPVRLPDPEKLVREFWEIVNNTKRVSVNILSEKDVTVEEVAGMRIVAIRVPRARRADKPVFVEGNPFTGSYRRSGEGDYRCTQDEVQAMLRDASAQSQDLTVLTDKELDCLDRSTVARYRARLKSAGTERTGEEEESFLFRIGAVGKGEDGKMHPTVAGLLMFGREEEIVTEFPSYRLEYREKREPSAPETEYVISSREKESGNVYDFYVRVYDRMLRKSAGPDGASEETDVCIALREVLTNSLINADYYGEQGVMIVCSPDRITFSNPGGFRIDVEAAKSGGVSDPRNGTLIRMFALIDIGRRSGSGIPNIFRVWKKQGWPAPVITETFDPDRITVTLQMGKSSNVSESTDDTGQRTAAKTTVHKQAIASYLTEKITAQEADIAALLGLSQSRTREILRIMEKESLVSSEGCGKDRTYRLKS